MQAPVNDQVLWSHRHDWSGNALTLVWTAHRVLKVTKARIVLSFERGPANGWLEQKTVSVGRAKLEQNGIAYCSGLRAQLYTEAAKAQEAATWRAQYEETAAYIREIRARGGVGHADRIFVSFEPHVDDGYSWPASADQVRRRFRELAKQFHPDAGGDAAEFVALNRSYQRALAVAGAS